MPLSSLRRTTRERKYALDAIEAALRRLQADQGGARSREEHIALIDSVAQELEGWQQKVRAVDYLLDVDVHGMTACGQARCQSIAQASICAPGTSCQ